MILSDDYIRALKEVNAMDNVSRMESVLSDEQKAEWFAKHTQEVTYQALKCVSAIPACSALEVGDLLVKVAEEIHESYEYVVCKRLSDGLTVRFRIEHLEDCFELTDVTEKILVC